MGVNKQLRNIISEYLPAKLLALGHPDGLEYADLRGSDIVIVDILPHTGREVIADLSQPGFDFGKFEVVLDHGTLEHVANPAQGFLNAAESVAVGGVIIHASPTTLFNHGYWNFNPVWFVDFYQTNDWRISELSLLNDAGPLPDSPTGNSAPPDACVLCVAQRQSASPVRLPRHEPKWTTPPAWMQAIRRARSHGRGWLGKACRL